MKKPERDQYFRAAAAMVAKQAAENPDIGIPVDPDVAEYMGAFEETAITLSDLDMDNMEPEDED